MFVRLAKSGLARLRPARPQALAPRIGHAGVPAFSNDNLPGVCRPAVAGKRQSRTPALTCHWFDRDGRLECRWQIGPGGDAPIGEADERGTKSRAAQPLSISPRRCGLALAG
jgi:hypothetical protein